MKRVKVDIREKNTGSVEKNKEEEGREAGKQIRGEDHGEIESGETAEKAAGNH